MPVPLFYSQKSKMFPALFNHFPRTPPRINRTARRRKPTGVISSALFRLSGAADLRHSVIPAP